MSPDPLAGLDRAVMEVLWTRGRAFGRTVARGVPGTPYTTVMSALQRLAEHGLAAREKRGKSWIYWPLLSREAYEAQVASEAAIRLLQAGPESALAAFVRTAASLDEAHLGRLEQLIHEHRRRPR